jgi:L-ascorbate metabolism protein UlaG (beta-lactamase superfamily)
MDGITFIGNATTLLRLGSFTLLTDPNFLHRGQRAYLGKGLWSRRLVEPAMQPGDLPQLDAVILSHLHGDHFDRIARHELARTAPVVTTPHAARRLERWGFDADALDTWEVHEQTHGQERLTVQSVPAVHARGLLGRLLPPVMGSWVEHHVDDVLQHRIYISGDTLTGDHVDEIHRRHPETDVAVVHLGGTRVLFSTVTMDADQGVDFVRRVDPGRVIPVHYDDYRVFKSPLSAFVDRAGEAGFGSRIDVPLRGETLPLPPVAAGA